MFIVQLLLISFIYSQKLTFQTSLFNHLYNNPNENICISPLSIYQIMSLLSNGAQALVPDSKINKKSLLKINDVNYKILNIYSKNKFVKIANAVMTKVNLIFQNFVKNIMH